MIEANTGLSENELRKITRVFQKFSNINTAILFGSRAMGTYHNGSDIDIALKGDDLKLNDILNVSIALDELSLPYKLDLIAFNRIQEPKLIDHIKRVGLILFNRT